MKSLRRPGLSQRGENGKNAFSNEILVALTNDRFLRSNGYKDNFVVYPGPAVKTVTLVIDEEASCKLDSVFAAQFLCACKNGPWMQSVRSVIPEPYLQTVEVHMGGSTVHGVWHADDTCKTMTVIVALNDLFNESTGGCTQVQEHCEDGNVFVRRLQCKTNEFIVFDGRKAHRRTAAKNKTWSCYRRIVVMHFLPKKRRWSALIDTRAMHAKLKKARKT